MSGVTCQTARDAILDLARGEAIPPPLRRDVESHIEWCDGCRVELQRQRELTAGLQALAAQLQPRTPAVAMEAELLRQFAAQHGQTTAGNFSKRRASRVMARRKAIWYGAAAAAVVVLAVWSGTRPANEMRLVPQNRAASGIRDGPAPGQPPAVVPTPVVAEDGLPRPPGRPVDPPRPPVIRTVEFLVLPDAGGLPAFESGTVVRVELPVAELPAYGLKIPPDAARSNVEADLLVGQDGQARAIRLVPEPEHSRSKE